MTIVRTMRLGCVVSCIVCVSTARAAVGPGLEQTTLHDFGSTDIVPLAAFRDGRVIVGEHTTGVIRLFDNAGNLSATPYATVALSARPCYHAGLLAFAIDPLNDDVYVYYNQRVVDTTVMFAIGRFHTMGDVGTSFENVVLDIPMGDGCHNGSGLSIGPDRKLYINTGDAPYGTSGLPNQAVVTDPNNIWGKVLRYNLDGTIPSDNPYGPSNPVWAVGFRNHMRNAWQPGSNRFYVNDFKNSIATVKLVTAGTNTYNTTGLGPLAPDTSLDRSIPFGMLFYRGSSVVAAGSLILANWGSATVYRLSLDASGTAFASSATPLVTIVPGVIDVAEGPCGELYFSQRQPNLVIRVRSTTAPTTNCVVPTPEGDAGTTGMTDGGVPPPNPGGCGCAGTHGGSSLICAIVAIGILRRRARR